METAAWARELILCLDAESVDVRRASRLLSRLLQSHTAKALAGGAAEGHTERGLQQALASYDALLRTIKGQVAAEQAQSNLALADRDAQILTLRQQLALRQHGSAAGGGGVGGEAVARASISMTALAAVASKRAPRTPPRDGCFSVPVSPERGGSFSCS